MEQDFSGHFGEKFPGATQHAKSASGCKENHFCILSFGQVEASIY